MGRRARTALLQSGRPHPLRCRNPDQPARHRRPVPVLYLHRAGILMAVEEQAPTERTTARRRIARALGWTARAFGLVLVAAVLLAFGALAYLRTESGLAQLTRLVEGLASNAQSRLTIGLIRGSFPEHLRLENVSLSDDRGALVSLDYAELRWRPWKLFSRHLDVSVFEIGIIDVHR